jgi:alpha-L-fucosidase 2
MMKKNSGLVFLLSVFLMMSCSHQIIRVACVGDSITEGYGLKVQSKSSYPVILDSILGAKYSVLNCGRSGTTLQKKGDFPYWICKEYSNVFAYKPNIIIIKLGTNDTKPYNWYADNFENDYQALIDSFKTIPSKPKIFVCFPAPVFKTKWGINDSTMVQGVIPIVDKLAQKNRLTIIDLYHGLIKEGANFPDSIHPNEKAVKVMATLIAKTINHY